MLTLSDFDFDLPPERIAQTPIAQRSASRLLEVGNGCAPPRLTDRRFTELPACIAPGDLLVFNDTRVLKARLWGRKPSGGKVEVLIERITGARTAYAQVRASKPLRFGGTLRLADAFEVAVERCMEAEPFYTLHFPEDCLTLIERYGQLPLPPYIARAADAARYQTVYATAPGAVAAPTAGLHFDEALLAQLEACGVQRATLTLHVGAGTFQPVRADNIREHRMHNERYHLPLSLAEAVARTRTAGGRIVAVGTTSLRALEAAALESPPDFSSALLRAGHGETNLFITPGYRFRVVDRLITNFHLPKSTLLILVCAFAGLETIRTAYAHAIQQHYRFFSYGDAMLLSRSPC